MYTHTWFIIFKTTTVVIMFLCLKQFLKIDRPGVLPYMMPFKRINMPDCFVWLRFSRITLTCTWTHSNVLQTLFSQPHEMCARKYFVREEDGWCDSRYRVAIEIQTNENRLLNGRSLTVLYSTWIWEGKVMLIMWADPQALKGW